MDADYGGYFCGNNLPGMVFLVFHADYPIASSVHQLSVNLPSDGEGVKDEHAGIGGQPNR